MTMKVFRKDDFPGALEGIKKDYRVVVPVREGDFHMFRDLEEGRHADFGYQNSRLSPKGVVYPQSERMFEYSLDEKADGAHIVKESEKEFSPQVIVGLRPCDAHGFSIVKVNFDNAEYRDPWWVKRFESTVLVGLGCTEPCPTCFCTSVGGGPFEERYLDALIYDLGERYLVKGITEKGEGFLGKLSGGDGAEEGVVKEAEALAEGAAGKVTAKVPKDKLKDKVVTELFGAGFWEDVAFGCLNCGTCTYVCPTCWCFDIQDEVYGKQGDRLRNWDSCMFPLFTLHGSGHNPREGKVQRVRQRFMHKLKYYVDKYENGVQCSGCGRCVRYCPVNIDIREVAVLMNGFGESG